MGMRSQPWPGTPLSQSPGLSHLVLTTALCAVGTAACFPKAEVGGSQRLTSPCHMASSSRCPRSCGEGAALSLPHSTPWGALLGTNLGILPLKQMLQFCHLYIQKYEIFYIKLIVFLFFFSF